MSGYEARCQSATVRQGLDIVVKALRAARLKHQVAQTGGFCMVVLCDVADGVVGISRSDEDPKRYLAIHYQGTSYDDGDEVLFDEKRDLGAATVDEVVAFVRRLS